MNWGTFRKKWGNDERLLHFFNRHISPLFAAVFDNQVIFSEKKNLKKKSQQSNCYIHQLLIQVNKRISSRLNYHSAISNQTSQLVIVIYLKILTIYGFKQSIRVGGWALHVYVGPLFDAKQYEEQPMGSQEKINFYVLLSYWYVQTNHANFPHIVVSLI